MVPSAVVPSSIGTPKHFAGAGEQRGREEQTFLSPVTSLLHYEQVQW